MPKHMPPKNSPSGPDGAAVIVAVLEAAKPRPTQQDDTSEKIKYATRFADAMAEHIATGLKSRLKGIEATTKRSAGSVFGKKLSPPERGDRKLETIWEWGRTILSFNPDTQGFERE